MKKIILIVAIVILASCGNKKENTGNQEVTPEIASLDKGEQLFQQNNCTSCHQLDQKVVGPSLQDIAKIYKAKNGNLVSFLKEEATPIIDPSMYETMKINLQVTKTMTDLELKSLEIYILNQSK